MKFIVECQLKPGKKNQAVEHFEQLGPNRQPGVSFRGAWVGAHSDVAYVLVESADDAAVRGATKSWPEIGDTRITEVIDVEHF